MKTAHPKLISALILIAFLLLLNGCMTETVIDHAQGVDKHGQPTGETNGAYYTLIPLTVPADIVTSPFQFIYICIGGQVVGL